MNQEVELFISKNCQWSKLPDNVKQLLGGSHKEYDKAVVNYSIKNQLRFKGNLVRFVRKDEEHYYEELLEYSKTHLMLYPYHLSDVMVRGLRVTPFQYYISMVESIMLQEKSYDALPNFTAADCLRLLGIGRNQYIDLMNQSRSGRKLFRRRNARELLPLKPISKMTIEPWWIVNIGCITEDDIKMASETEKVTIDYTIDNGPQKAGILNYADLTTLYGKGLIYLEVPIESSDHISVPPLEGFVMNRVLGDYFETLLYKIFVSVDEKTSVGELANVLQIGVDQVKNAVSVYCRLGFARKKNCEVDLNSLHNSWHDILNASPHKLSAGNAATDDDPLLAELTAALAELGNPLPISEIPAKDNDLTNIVPSTDDIVEGGVNLKRVAFLFDSTLTAFLMMGNLSPGLKSHAVTMFEVGKLSDESLDSLLSELERISTDDSEGEAQRYFEHALTLKSTVQFLRKTRPVDGEISSGWNAALDLIRVESLQSLDADTCGRLLRKNYHLLVAMAPLSMDVRAGSVDSLPPFWGPPLPEFTSPWFKLFLYHLTGEGPPTLLLAKGERLRRLPSAFNQCERMLISPWGHESGLVVSSNALLVLNEALTHSAVMVQGYGNNREEDKVFVPFPLINGTDDFWKNHSVVRRLCQVFDLENNCGFITMINVNHRNFPNCSNRNGAPTTSPVPNNGIKDSSCAEILQQELDSLEEAQKASDTSVGAEDQSDVAPASPLETAPISTEGNWTILTVDYGIPLFDSQLNRSVCERIVSKQIWRKETLDSLVQTHQTLSNLLLDFIHSHVDFPVDDKITRDVSLPTKNLLFLNGTLEAWNGH